MIVSKNGIELIGYAAACMTTVSFLPQLIRVVKLRFDGHPTDELEKIV